MTDPHGEEWAVRDDAPDGGGPDGTSAPDAEAPPLPGLFRRAVMVVVSPGDVFPALAARPKWFGATLLAAAFGCLEALLPSDALPEQLTRQGAAAPDIPASVVVFLQLLVIPATLAVYLVLVLAASGLTYVALVFLRGDEATFKQHLSVMSHAWIITGLGFAVLFVMNQVGLSVRAESLSVGGLLPFLPDGFLARFLRLVSLFSLWGAVVAGLGLSLLDPRRRWAPTAAVTVGLVLAFALLGALLMSAFTSAST